MKDILKKKNNIQSKSNFTDALYIYNYFTQQQNNVWILYTSLLVTIHQIAGVMKDSREVSANRSIVVQRRLINSSYWLRGVLKGTYCERQTNMCVGVTWAVAMN